MFYTQKTTIILRNEIKQRLTNRKQYYRDKDLTIIVLGTKWW